MVSFDGTTTSCENTHLVMTEDPCDIFALHTAPDNQAVLNSKRDFSPDKLAFAHFRQS